MDTFSFISLFQFSLQKNKNENSLIAMKNLSNFYRIDEVANLYMYAYTSIHHLLVFVLYFLFYSCLSPYLLHFISLWNQSAFHSFSYIIRKKKQPYSTFILHIYNLSCLFCSRLKLIIYIQLLLSSLKEISFIYFVIKRFLCNNYPHSSRFSFSFIPFLNAYDNDDDDHITIYYYCNLTYYSFPLYSLKLNYFSCISDAVFSFNFFSPTSITLLLSHPYYNCRVSVNLLWVFASSV